MFMKSTKCRRYEKCTGKDHHEKFCLMNIQNVPEITSPRTVQNVAKLSH